MKYTLEFFDDEDRKGLTFKVEASSSEEITQQTKGFLTQATDYSYAMVLSQGGNCVEIVKR